MNSKKPKHVLITGASGVIGRHFCQYLAQEGISFSVFSYHLTAIPGATQILQWRPDEILGAMKSDLSSYIRCLNQCDVVLNLSGSTIAKGRLGAAHQKQVLNSRVYSVQALLKLMDFCDTPPHTWVQASAIGFYGDTGDTMVDEGSARGSLFLSDVCDAWETTLLEGISGLSSPPRVVIARIGLVLGLDAPAWQKMLLPIQWGVSGRLGSGSQWWSWVHVDDVTRALYWFMVHDDMVGVYNLTSPYPVQQRVFMQLVSKRCQRPSFLPVPAWALRLVLGGIATELLLPSNRVQSERLLQYGFQFKYATFEAVLDALL